MCRKRDARTIIIKRIDQEQIDVCVHWVDVMDEIQIAWHGFGPFWVSRCERSVQQAVEWGEDGRGYLVHSVGRRVASRGLGSV